MLTFTLRYLGHEHMNNIMLPVPYTSLTSHKSSSVAGSLKTTHFTFQMLPIELQETDSARYIERRFWNKSWVTVQASNLEFHD